MKVVRIGLVAEGKTDHIVLKALVGAYFQAERPDIKPEFIDIQPDPDGTSGNRDGGWSHVFAWCQRNNPARRQVSFLGRGLFADGMNAKLCDLLLFVLDADASAEIARKSPIAAPPPPPAPILRGQFIRQTLDAWLWPNDEQPRDRHATAAAVEAVEAWLIAAMGNISNPETISDLQSHFVPLFNSRLGRPMQAKQKRIAKTTPNYQKISDHAKNDVKKINSSCDHFRYLIQSVLTIVGAIP